MKGHGWPLPASEDGHLLILGNDWQSPQYAIPLNRSLWALTVDLLESHCFLASGLERRIRAVCIKLNTLQKLRRSVQSGSRDSVGTPPTRHARISVWVCFRVCFRRLVMRLRVLAGTLYNWAGIPGLVRDCDYEAGVTDAHVKVRVRELYTIVTVHGLDVYFNRLSGFIDGVGAAASSPSVSTQQSTPARELFGPVPPQSSRTRNP